MQTRYSLRTFSRLPAFFFSSKQLSQAALLERVKNGESIVIDVRKPQLGIQCIKNCFWMSPKALVGGWFKILNKSDSFVVYEGQQLNESDKGVSAQLLTDAGFQNVEGTLTMKANEIKDAGVATYPVEFADKVNEDGYTLLDVRRPDEWLHGMVDGTVTAYELGQLAKNPESLNKKYKYIIHCAHGVRSMIAFSLLKRNGYEAKVYTGTWDDIKRSGVKIRQL